MQTQKNYIHILLKKKKLKQIQSIHTGGTDSCLLTHLETSFLFTDIVSLNTAK